MEPSLIGPISVIKCAKQVRQSQHNHGLMDNANRGKVVGKIICGSVPKIRWIDQSHAIHGGNFKQERWTQSTHFFWFS